MRMGQKHMNEKKGRVAGARKLKDTRQRIGGNHSKHPAER